MKQSLTRALQASQVLVTLDKDFGELAVVHQLPHHGIIRLVTIRAERQGTTAVEVLAKYGADLIASAIVTVEPNRVRVRPHDAASPSEDGPRRVP